MMSMITDLKSSHFALGREQGARLPTNVQYGTNLNAHEASVSAAARGHGLATSFILGSDRPNRITEQRDRFAGAAANIDKAEREEIKTRMCSDSVTIGGPDRTLA